MNEIKKICGLCLALVLGVLGVPVLAQVALDVPVANLTEHWDINAAGWTTDDALCGWTNQAMLFKCNVRAPSDYVTYISKIKGGTNSSSGYYVGNLSKIEAVSFNVMPSVFSLNPNFYVKAKSGIVWKTKFGLALVGKPDASVVNIVLPLTYSTNWWSGWSSDMEQHFSEDITNIVEVGFEFVRYPEDAAVVQQLAIDDFKLTGPWTGPFTNGVPISWVLENGLPTTNLAAIGSLDSDGDGFSNAAEFLAGTDPNNSNSFFRVSIERNAAGKMVLKWAGNKYVTYDLLEAASLGDGNGFTTKAANISALSSEVETNIDEGVSAQHFYKVQINAKN